MENELPAGSGSVDLLREALKANLPVIQLSDAGDEVFQGASQAIQLPDDQGIASPDIRDCFLKTLPLRLCP